MFCLISLLLITAAVCFAASGTNEGMTLTIPEEYKDLLLISYPKSGPDGIIFVITEKASVQAARDQGMDAAGIGWLFSIGSVTEERLHELLCRDMSGMRVFAKDEADRYYILYTPTDVRVVRQNYTDEELADWRALQEWTSTVPAQFIADNEGLTAESYGNTELDIFLANMMYQEDTEYTVSTLQYGPLSPNGIKAADYIEPLTKDVFYEIDLDAETPDGEYVVLNFPEYDYRFDFFQMDGKENYIRQIWCNGQDEIFYKANFKDDTIKASEIMQNFYDAIVRANFPGTGPDEMTGIWAEKIAGRGAIEISKGTEAGKYDIQIRWSASAAQVAYWEMTAEATGNGDELRYENGRHTIQTWQSEDQMTEEEVYTNGTGSFRLLDTGELVWNDGIEQAAEGTVFINAGK